LRSYITIATRELFTYRAEEYSITIGE